MTDTSPSTPPGTGRVLVLVGPNLGRLGTREPHIYGTATHADLVEACEKTGAHLGLRVEVRQTDDEATMLGWLHEAADDRVPVVLNPGAWTHYSYAVRDACSALTADLIEVHMSQLAAREPFRSVDVIAPVATATITGLGFDSYLLALQALAGRKVA